MKSPSVGQEWQYSTVHKSACLCLEEQTLWRFSARTYGPPRGVGTEPFGRDVSSPELLLEDVVDRQRYRLCLETGPDTGNLPAGMTVLGHEGGWWRVQVQVKPSEGPSSLWGELWDRGWKILEIRSEASSLEEIYMSHTGQERHQAPEVV